MGIDHPWALYGEGGCLHIGLVVEETPGSASILYSSGQMYPPEAWDKGYVQRFATPNEAIDYAFEHGLNSKTQLERSFLRGFPCPLLKAQSSPSRTEDDVFERELEEGGISPEDFE